MNPFFYLTPKKMKNLFSLFILSSFFSSAILAKENGTEMFKKELGRMSFTENKGQLADIAGTPRTDILYMTKNKGMQVYFAKDRISYVVSQAIHQENSYQEENTGYSLSGPDNVQPTGLQRIDMEFINPNPNVQIIAEDEESGYSNYYYPHCPNGILGVKSYKKLIYQNIYPDIDLIFYASSQNSSSTLSSLKYDFIVHPGAKPSDIKIHYNGASFVSLASSNDLSIGTIAGNINESMPLIYQPAERNNSVSNISGNYALHNGFLTFEIPSYDLNKSLIIDPWATYIGNNSSDIIKSLITDHANNIILSGYTESSTFPTKPDAYQTGNNGLTDALVIKFDNNGNYLWSTYYGGSSYDGSGSVAVDLNNNIFFGGETLSSDFPNPGTGTSTYKQGGDAFVVKMNPSGTPQWRLFFGGVNEDICSSIAIDAGNNVIITGNTSSPDLPVVGCVPSTLKGPSGASQKIDAYVAKFDNTGLLQFSTYLGGASQDYGLSITTDAANNVIISGTTNSTDFTGLTGNSGKGGFIIKLGSNCLVQWGKYWSRGYDVAATAGGDIAVTGTVPISGNLPLIKAMTTSQTYSFISKFDATGDTLWSTYFDIAEASSIDINTAGEVFVTGYRPDNNFPVTMGSPSYKGSYEVITAKLASDGQSIKCASFYGGSGYDVGKLLALDGIGNIYIAGTTSSLDLPVNSNSYQKSKSGGNNFLTQLCSQCGTPSVKIQGIDSICLGDSTVLTASGIGTFSWSTGATGNSIVVKPTTNTTITVTSSLGNCSASDAMNIVVRTKPAIPDVQGQTKICKGSIASLQALSSSNQFEWYSDTTKNFISNNNPLTTGPIDKDTTFYVRVNNGFCYSFFKKVQVKTDTLPKVKITAPERICSGDSAILKATGAPDGYTWNTGSVSDQITVSPTKDTTYWVEGKNGACIDTFRITLYVDSPLTVPVLTCGTNTDTSISFSWNKVTGATGYEVSIDGGANWHKPKTNTSDTIKNLSPNQSVNILVHAKGDLPCGNSKDASITCKTTACPLDGTISATQDTICINKSTTLQAISNKPLVTYKWSPGNSLNDSTIANPIASPKKTTTYTLTISDANCSITREKTIIVKQLPIAIISKKIRDTLEIKCEADDNNNILSWEWSFGDRTENEFGQKVTHIYQQPGYYTICLMVTNDCGTDTTCVDSVEIKDIKDTTGIGKVLDANNNIVIFPNPFKDLFNIQLKINKPSFVNISIYDVLGRQVYQGENEKWMVKGDYLFTIPANDLYDNNHVLFIIVQMNGQRYVQKLIKE